MPFYPRQPFEIGARWAYRDHPKALGTRTVQVEVLQFGRSRSNKVRILYIDDLYPGLDEWVAKICMMVPWDEAADLLRDEQRFVAVRAASRSTVDAFEREAVWHVCGAYPRPDGMLIDEDGTIEIASPGTVAFDLRLEPGDLFADPLAFIDRHGTYMAPWTTALRLAHRVCEVFSEAVLHEIGEVEAKLQREAIEGYQPMDYPDWWVPPPAFLERCAQRYREHQPIFAMVRSWCHSDDLAKFDELTASRAESARYHSAIESVIADYERDQRYRRANELRALIGAERPPKRKRAPKSTAED